MRHTRHTVHYETHWIQPDTLGTQIKLVSQIVFECLRERVGLYQGAENSGRGGLYRKVFLT